MSFAKALKYAKRDQSLKEIVPLFHRKNTWVGYETPTARYSVKLRRGRK